MILFLRIYLDSITIIIQGVNLHKKSHRSTYFYDFFFIGLYVLQHSLLSFLSNYPHFDVPHDLQIKQPS